MPQRSQLDKLDFPDITKKTRAMIVQANMPEKIKYKPCKECLNCATYLSNLAVVILNGKIATRYKHFHEAKPCNVKCLRNWGEASTVSMRKIEK